MQNLQFASSLVPVEPDLFFPSFSLLVQFEHSYGAEVRLDVFLSHGFRQARNIDLICKAKQL